jgi:hypothetical protein
MAENNMGFVNVDLHIKQRAKQRQAVKQLLAVAGGPR